MIIVNAKLHLKEENFDDIIKQSELLINASRKHKGNISYNLYQDVLDEKLIFIEKWESKEDLDEHMKTQEFIDFGESIKEFLTAPLDIKLISGDEI